MASIGTSTGNIEATVNMWSDCMKKNIATACMNKDIIQLVEMNYGPLDKVSISLFICFIFFNER